MRYLLGITKDDIRSTTVRNLNIIQGETGLDPCVVAPKKIRESPVFTEVPAQDMWRMPLLDKRLSRRREMEVVLEDTEEIVNMIDALCST